MTLLRHLRHENVIAVVDIMAPPTAQAAKFADVYLVYDLMDTDLHQIIRSPQPLSDDHAQYFIYQARPILFLMVRTRTPVVGTDAAASLPVHCCGRLHRPPAQHGHEFAPCTGREGSVCIRWFVPVRATGAASQSLGAAVLMRVSDNITLRCSVQGPRALLCCLSTACAAAAGPEVHP